MNSSNNHTTKADILRAMRDMLAEAPSTEMVELAQEAGCNAGELSKIGRSAIAHAMEQSKQDESKDEKIIPLHKGLSSLILMLRRRDGLDEDELARKADVAEEEIRKIEYDALYLPSPRTIYKLEQVFSLPAGVLAKLSGAIRHHSTELEERVQEFAANAKSMGKLTKAERELLNAFVRFLAGKE